MCQREDKEPVDTAVRRGVIRKENQEASVTFIIFLFLSGNISMCMLGLDTLCFLNSKVEAKRAKQWREPTCHHTVQT